MPSQKRMNLQRVPESKPEWSNAVNRLRIAEQSIHTFPNPSSASKIGFEQYLLLQVIYVIHSTRKGLLTETDSSLLQSTYYQQATKILDIAKNKANDTDYWALYLRSFDEKINLEDPNFPKLGTFSLVRDFQIQCHQITATDPTSVRPKFTPIAQRTRSAIGRKGAEQESPSVGRVGRHLGQNTKDIIGGLEKISLDTPRSSTPNPEKSTIDSDDSASDLEDFTSEASAARYYVQGASGADLQTVEDEQIVNTALILFLRAMTMHFDLQAHWSLHRRAFNLGQSGSEVFEARVDGYLCSGDKKVKAILEVKRFERKNDQNGIHRHEVYLTVATYKAEYVDYVTQKESNPAEAFLFMNEYGPYETQNGGDVARLGRIVLAFALQECPRLPSASSIV